MLKLFKRKDVDIRLELKGIPFLNFYKVIFFLLIGIVLATRDLYIAADDYNYLNYFYDARIRSADNLIIYLIEEPLWRLYTILTTFVFNPEVAFKFTLFLSTSLFLFSTNRVNRKLFPVIILVFILQDSLATQLYFNQIRQGLALSLFLFIAIYGKRPIFGAILATLIHTSFLFPLGVIVLVTRIKSMRLVIICSIIAIIGLYFGIKLLENLDFGRRSERYEFEGVFTINYYISVIIRYVPLFILIKFYNKEKNSGYWYKITLSAFIIFIPFTLLYSASGRVMYYFSAFVLLMILENYRSLGGKIALSYYLFFLLLQAIITNHEVLERWGLILKI